MKKGTKVTYKKSAAFLAAAVLTSALLGGNVYPAFADNDYAYEASELSRYIPENVTIDEPTALYNIELPKNDHGTLKWVSEDYVPEQRVQSCSVAFYPKDGLDLSYLSGWDEEKGALTGTVTVVVSSLEEQDYQESEEYQEDYEDSQEGTEDTEVSAEEVTEESVLEDSPEEEPAETPETEASGAEVSPLPTEPPALTESPEAPETEVPEAEAAENQEEEQEASEPEENPLPTETPVLTESPEASETEVSQAPTETPEAAVSPAPAEPEEELPEENQDNIFDNPSDFEVPDSRPTTAEEELTPEEQAARASENHTYDGISVSGIDLPWYVQFRVTSGESYEFRNETEAAIFQSYEFELWDLKNDTEYEIPDGEYISVTVPVKEGYDYTIEHLLDNGAIESIVPSVEGSTMIFSTHSFSPFGIAGNKPIVGGDIAEDGYSGTSTPAPNAPVTVKPTQKPVVTGTAPNVSNTGNNTNSTNISTNNSNTNNTVNNGSYDNDWQPSQNDSQDYSYQPGSSSNAVNTGDNTMILPFVILIAAAVVIIAVIVVVKKKKK